MIRVNTFKLKVKLLLFLNKLVRRCRMYERRPGSPGELCEVCARRGGFFLCRHPQRLMVKGDGCGGPFPAQPVGNIKTEKEGVQL
jgi:hypothetical protein